MAQYLSNDTLIKAISSNDDPAIWASCRLLAERVAATYLKDKDDLISAATLKLVSVIRAGKVKLDGNPFSFLTRVAMNELNREVASGRKHRAVVSLDEIERRSESTGR